MPSRAPITHDLKCWPTPFAAVISGAKTHEVRVADRDYGVGDLLVLREWEPCPVCGGEGKRWDSGDKTSCDACLGRCTVVGYTGRATVVRVTYITEGGTFGVPAGMCVMSVTIERLAAFGVTRMVGVV